jgi:ketosteroid isomerase-like protein
MNRTTGVRFLRKLRAAPLLFTTLMTSAPAMQAAEPSPAESEIIRLSAEKFRWKTERQIDRVEDIFDDDLIFVHLNGNITSKNEWISQLRSGRFIYNAIEVKEVSAKSYGDAAVLVGKAEYTVTMTGFRSKYRLVYTEVYAKKDGRWKLVNLHTCSY